MSIADPSTAAAFRALHAPGGFLVLPNAWDAGSARVIEECGAPAIATTSSGLGWANGYADGGALPPRVLADAVAAITRVVRVPLSVDAEAGYADDPAAVAEVVAAIVDGGAVGINLEDGTQPPDLLCAKIAAAKDAAARAGVDLFVNARIDVFLRGLVPAGERVAATVDRARRYLAAGCDGVFAPRASAPDDLRALAAAVAPAPLNVMAVPGLAPATELRAAGVRRLSAGSAVAAAALARARSLATDFLRDGRSDPLFTESVDYAGMNALFAAR